MSDENPDHKIVTSMEMDLTGLSRGDLIAMGVGAMRKAMLDMCDFLTAHDVQEANVDALRNYIVSVELKSNIP